MTTGCGRSGEGDPNDYQYDLETVALMSVLPEWKWPYWSHVHGKRMMPRPTLEEAEAARAATKSLVGCLDADL